MLTPLDRNAMLDAIDIRGKVCVEVGVAQGDYSDEILRRKPATLYLVDSWQTYPGWPSKAEDWAAGHKTTYQKMYEQVCKKYARNSNILIKRKFSIMAALDFNCGVLDFVYIDACHEFKAVMADIEAWWPMIKNGGWLCGHDYSDPNNIGLGVKEAVDKWCAGTNHPLDLLTNTKGDGGVQSWGVRK